VRGHIRSAVLDIDTKPCTGCGVCVEACPANVLRVQGPKWLNDHHVRISSPDACNGCLACVTACPRDAIRVLAGS